MRDPYDFDNFLEALRKIERLVDVSMCQIIQDLSDLDPMVDNLLNTFIRNEYVLPEGAIRHAEETYGLLDDCFRNILDQISKADHAVARLVINAMSGE